MLEQFIEDTNRANNSEEIFRLYQKALKNYGYDSICYCLVTDYPTYGLKANHGAIQNYSDEWIDHYTKKEYKQIDPVLQFCFKTSDIFSWDQLIKQKKLADDESLLMSEAKEAKLLNGLALPVHGLNGELTAIGLASTDSCVDINKDTLHKIRALSIQFHLAYIEKEANFQPSQYTNHTETNITLSDREREVLLWMSEGKSDSIIAEVIGISYATVRYHTNNIFQKLGVNERTLAVVKAIRYGLILPTYLKRI